MFSLDFFLPDKPIPEIERPEEKIVPLLPFRRLSGFVVIIMIAFSIISTSIVFSLGFIFDSQTVLYFFVPIVVFFSLTGLYFQIALIIELILIALALIAVFTNKEVGLLKDYDQNSHKIITFSEVFLIGYFLSIILVTLFPPGKGIEIPSFELHRVALAAPICEEFSFRFIWLIIPSWIIYLKLSEGKYNTDESSSSTLLKMLVSGKEELNRYDWILITASAIFFGISHYVSVVFIPEKSTLEVTFGWEYGKIIQASVMGFLMGYLALRYGLGLSITFHWLVNSFSVLGYILFLSSNFLLLALFGLLVLFFAFVGLIAFVAVIYRFWKS